MSTEIQALPELLFKSFEKIEHAESFLAGNIRFSTLKHFREIEDAHRKDVTEGMGHGHVCGEKLVVDLDAHTISSQPGVESLVVPANQSEHFICCFSMCETDNLDDLPRKFGRYCVKVSNPADLFRDLARAMAKDPGLSKNPPTLEAGKVCYDKGSFFQVRPGRDDLLRLAWLQKPECFTDEHELRYHFQFSFASLIDYPSVYELSVGRKLEYCKFFVLDV